MLPSLVRWLQLLMALMGLILSGSPAVVTVYLMVAFALVLIYTMVILIGNLLGRNIVYGRTQVVLELVLVSILLIGTIHSAITCKGDLITISILLCGFVLSALLIITIHDGY